MRSPRGDHNADETRGRFRSDDEYCDARSRGKARKATNDQEGHRYHARRGQYSRAIGRCLAVAVVALHDGRRQSDHEKTERDGGECRQQLKFPVLSGIEEPRVDWQQNEREPSLGQCRCRIESARREDSFEVGDSVAHSRKGHSVISTARRLPSKSRIAPFVQAVDSLPPAIVHCSGPTAPASRRSRPIRIVRLTLSPASNSLITRVCEATEEVVRPCGIARGELPCCAAVSGYRSAGMDTVDKRHYRYSVNRILSEPTLALQLITSRWSDLLGLLASGDHVTWGTLRTTFQFRAANGSGGVRLKKSGCVPFAAIGDTSADGVCIN